MNQEMLDKLKDWRDYSGSESDLIDIFKGYILLDNLLILTIIDCLHSDYVSLKVRKILQDKIKNERY